jgi:2-dehydro-3-deoxygalactonokinase
MQQFFLSCDWGTSSFRLRLVNIRNREVMGELITKEGVSATHQLWMESNATNPVSKAYFFFSQVKLRINELFKMIAFNGDVETVIISGMASSSLGLEELPYATMPFSLDGENIGYKYFNASEEFPYQAFLLSGVKSGKDLMRGEETQMIGLAEEFTIQGREDCTCIITGTHSKHIRVEHNKITDVDTYMTGEIFQLMSKNSVLSDCVADITGYGSFSGSHAKAFEKGVSESATSNFLNRAFSIRVNHLFQRFSKPDNSFYLSGLLIATELGNLQMSGSKCIVLASEEPLLNLYKKALILLGIVCNTVFIDPIVFNKSVVNAHARLFKTFAYKVR